VSGGRVAPVYSEQARPEKQRFMHAQEQRVIPAPCQNGILVPKALVVTQQAHWEGSAAEEPPNS